MITKNPSKILIIYVIFTMIIAIPISAEDKKIGNLQNEIDRAGFNWVAGNTSVSGLTTEEKLHLCGVTNEILNTDHITHTIKDNGVNYVNHSSEINWCDKDGENWVTSVKNQKGCGSCCAFSALGSIEACINIESDSPSMDVDLSEQHIVSDCCEAVNCDCGSTAGTFEYIMSKSIFTEEYFPYIARSCPCIPHPIGHKIYTIENIMYFDTSNDTLKWAIENHGPLSITLRLNVNDWSYYSGGIFEPVNKYHGGHAVVLVGYNDTDNYWIVKNSWGTNWGEDGYIRIKYGSLPTYRYGIVATNITSMIKLVGDINGDNTVNYIDLGMLGVSYGLSVGDAGYNAAADLNGDNTVNYVDLGMLGAHYGESI